MTTLRNKSKDCQVTKSLEELNKAYQQLDLTSYSSEEIRRMIQFTFLKAAKEDGLQMNHQMTPDAIGLLVAYMIDQMTKKDEPLQIADFAAGSGNLLSTILLFLQSAGKTASATAIDNDEVLAFSPTSIRLRAIGCEDFLTRWLARFTRGSARLRGQ